MKSNRTLCAMIATLVVCSAIGLSSLIAGESKAPTGPFFGSSKSTIYHVGGCEWTSRIAKQNLIAFGSREAAESTNYRPCKVCNPHEMRVFVSTQSDKYHLLNCEWTGRMLFQNIRAYKSAKSAQDAGMKPCEVCKP